MADNGRSIYASGLNGQRNQVLADAVGVNPGNNVAFIANTFDEQSQSQQSRDGMQPQVQKFLQGVGMLAANRGVNKALMTPAMQNGVMPVNQKLFGVEPKQPVPYQKVVLDKQNLNAVLKGYQEIRQGMGGPVSTDTANMIANIKRSEQIIASSLKKQRSSSIFDGVPKSAATNLYNIGVKNQRENSIYALV